MKTSIFLPVALCMLGCGASAQIVVSEIHYHPVEEPAFNTDGTPVLDLADDVHEFVEIQNTGSSAVDLGGWTLSGGIGYPFPTNTTIAAGEFRVIAKNPARLATVYSLTASTVLGPYTGLLGNGSDTVRVRDASGTAVDAVTYDSKFPWAASADALGAQDRFTGLTSSSYQYKGRSLQRVSVSGSSSDPANWLASPLTGPTPGAAQAVTRTVPKPVVTAQSAVQTTDGAALVRAGNAVTVNVTFSATNGLGSVLLEYFVDNVNSTTETRTAATMTDLGSGKYTGSIPGQTDRSIVRYRFKADRGEGIEVVSPRTDDPQIAPVGASGAREAWHGYFVTPVRTSSYPIYDVFVSTASLSQMNANITQTPKRVTVASATGVPREIPYVAATAAQWNGTQPAVFACNGEVWDIQIRYHGSLYHRAAANNSFKLHFPEHQPFNAQSSWFITGHGTEFIEAQKINRLLGLPASKMRTADWYYNSNAKITRSEQGEYAGEMLDAYHSLQQQLNPGSDKEETGELYKVVGNRDASQNNKEGPYTRGDEAPLAANSGWTQLQRYAWTLSQQNHGWKGSKPVRDLIEGMWTARGDTPSTHSFSSTAAKLASAKAWFTNHWDIETTLTSMALLEWMSIWDDAAQNHFFWKRASGKWSRLGWDYDQVMSTSTGGGGGGGGGMGGGASQTIYGGEYGATTVFDGVNWWKDTFYKCFRTEYNQRLWELNNSFFDPANLTAQGLTTAATFANSRRTYVNSQLSSLGTYSKPARPSNAAPASGATLLRDTNLTTSAYSHPQPAAHASTKWEIRSASGDYEEPILCQTSTVNLTSLSVPFDQLTYGQTYYWRATHIDANGHPSVVSAETSFTWGASSTTAGTLVLNEVLAINRNTVQNGGSYPDYVELRNNGTTAITLTGYTITDDPLEPAKFTFPTGTPLAAGGYLTVWCDDDASALGIHAGFGLDGDGDQVLLLNGSTLVDSLTFGPQAPDVSLGRIVNGTGGWQANTPTPGTANSAKTLGSVSHLRLNEWMASPAYGEDWFEIYNSDDHVVALAGLYLSDTPATPTITKIPALSFIAGRGYVRFWADGSGAGGNHGDFKLGSSGETLVLTAANGATALDTVTFGAQATDVSQGRLPDGSSTIVSFSSQTASPGSVNWAPADVRVNEVLANAASPFEDAIELYNPSAGSVSVSGWWLSDDRFDREKFQIPAGTTVPAGGYLVFYESSFNSGTTPFSLSAFGDEVILSAVDSSGELTGYGSLARFGAMAENGSSGAVAATGLGPSSGGAEFWAQSTHTFGEDNPANVAAFRSGSGLANETALIGSVILNEIMYHPTDDAEGTDDTTHEYVELYNPTASAVDLSGWRFKGDSEYTLPAGTTLGAGAYLLLVSFDPAEATTLTTFLTDYRLSAETTVLGPYSPRLQNNTHNVEIARPVTISSSTAYVLVDKVEYRDITPWPESPDGTGQSLQRTRSTVIGNTAANWLGDRPTPGAVNAGVVVGLAVTTESSLPGGVVGSAYSATLAAAGGTTPYSWTMTPSSVSGLVLSSAGILSGTPTTAGVFTVSVQVTDNKAATATQSLEITIAPSALVIATDATLPEGTVAATYSQTLLASGGTLPYTWSLSRGTLPGGLTLNGAGVLSGTPTHSGTFSFTVRVADDGGLVATRAFSLHLPVPPLTITSASTMVAAELDTPYSQALTAVGGTAPYAWSLVSGTLPSGLSLISNGTLSGTPTASGVFGFTAQVADRADSTVSKLLSLTVVPQTLVITVASLPDGIVGDAYSQSLAATGGIAPYTWTVAAGTLPGGLSLTSAGVISGTLRAAATNAFAVRAMDSINTSATCAYTVTVEASGPLDHFTWDYVPTEAWTHQPFAVRLSARDSAERVVTGFSDAVGVSAASGSGSLTSPILITEMTDGGEDQFELQNVTSAAVDTTGWFVVLGDSLTDINTLNSITYSLSGTLEAGALLRVTESSTSTADGRLYFGSSIGWSSSAGANTKGWIMLFDATYTLRDFVTIGWAGTDLLNLSVEINGNAVIPSSQWSGDPVLPGTRSTLGNTLDSWQRLGTNDSNTATDWAWRHNTGNTDATSFNATNSGLTVPFASTTPVTTTPSSLTLASGECAASLTISEAVSDVRLTADDGEHTGISAAFSVTAEADPDTDDDGMPDAWETEHGLAVGTNDAELDPDSDGLSNLEEHTAGTDPHSAASSLMIVRVSVDTAGQLTITWPGVAGKTYHLSTSTDLTTWTSPDTSFTPTTSGVHTATIEIAGATPLFVRVRVGSAP